MYFAISSRTRSSGTACDVRPLTPVTVVAMQRALTIASSVASAVGLEERSHRVRLQARTANGAIRVAGEHAAVGGREGEEEVAAAVVAVAADPGEPDRRPPRDPPALVRQQRRVGGDDDDDRAFLRLSPGVWLGTSSKPISVPIGTPSIRNVCRMP